MISVNQNMFSQGQTVLIRECDFSTTQLDELISRSNLEAKFRSENSVEVHTNVDQSSENLELLKIDEFSTNRVHQKTSNTISVKPKTDCMENKCINLVVLRKKKDVEKKVSLVKKENQQLVKNTHALCSMCGKHFTTNYNLKRHMIGCKLRPDDEKVVRFSCTCGRSYSQEWDLKKHKATCQETDFKFKSCMFPLCNLLFYHRAQLLAHLKSAHNVSIREPEIFHFESIDDFKVWKEKIEEETYTYYSKQTGSNVTGVSVNTYYVCQHDGSDRTHGSSPRKTKRRNKKGRVKTGRFCWSQMNVKEYRDGTVKVTFHPSHTHLVSAADTEHHPLPSSITSEIQRRLVELNNVEDGGITEIKKSRKRAVSVRTLRALARKNRKLFRITAEAVGDTEEVLPQPEVEEVPTEDVIPVQVLKIEEEQPSAEDIMNNCVAYCSELKDILTSGKVDDAVKLTQVQNTLATLINLCHAEFNEEVQVKKDDVAYSNDESSIPGSQITLVEVGEKLDGAGNPAQSDGKTIYRVVAMAGKDDQIDSPEGGMLYQNAVEFPREFIIIDQGQIFQTVGNNQLALSPSPPPNAHVWHNPK